MPLFDRLRLQELAQRASQDDPLLLPRLEAGWHGAALAVAGAAVGEGWAVLTKAGSVGSAGGSALGWLALIMVFAGLLMQLTQFKARGGWRVCGVEFARVCRLRVRVCDAGRRARPQM